MKQKLKKGARRAAAVLAAITLWASLAASALAAPVAVSTAQELVDELNAAASSSTSTTIVYDTGVASITLNNGTVTIASNTTLDLSASGGTLRIEGGTVYVSGTISGGTVVVAGGTLVRNSGSSITASISISGSGTVRKAYTLSLENLDPASTEKITSIVYSGDADADDSGFVTLAANGVIYPEMANKSDFKIIESVTTDAEHVFRLGTNSTGTLSLEYAISYSGMDGATLTSANPDSYTASDAAIQLCNPTRDGYTFDGWTCAQLSVIDPTTTMVIPEGTTGVLTFTAIWTEIPTGAGGSMGGGQSSTGSSSSTSSDDEE